MCRAPGCAGGSVPAAMEPPSVAASAHTAERRREREEQAALHRLYGRWLARLPVNVLSHSPPPRVRPPRVYQARYRWACFEFKGRPSLRKWAARLLGRLIGREPGGDCGCFMALLRLRRWAAGVPRRLRAYFSVRLVQGPPPEHLQDLLVIPISPTAKALASAAGTDVSVWSLEDYRLR